MFELKAQAKPKHRPGGLTWAQYAFVCESLNQGESVTSIAKKIGRTETTLHQWLRNLGLAEPPKPRLSRRKQAPLNFGDLETAWKTTIRN